MSIFVITSDGENSLIQFNGIYFLCVCVSGCQGSVEKNSSGRVTLGEQAAAIQNPHDRVMALRRVTAAAQVLLARTMVMRALSLLSVRYTSSKAGPQRVLSGAEIPDLVKGKPNPGLG